VAAARTELGENTMARLLDRLGRFAARRRWTVLLVWLGVLLVAGGMALGFRGDFSSSISIPGTPSQHAMNQLGSKLPTAGGASGRIVFAVPAGDQVLAPAHRDQIAAVVGKAADLTGVLAVVGPVDGKTVSPDQRVAYAQIQFAGDESAVPPATQHALAALAAAHDGDGLRIELGGAAVSQMPAIGSTEGIGVAVALVVLLLTFGAVVAAGLPLLTALAGVGVGMSGIVLVARFVDMSSTAPILALMLGLAVGIDYALFIVSKHRAQLRAGMPLHDSIGRAVGTAGSAVVFAGATVLIALAGLAVVGIPFLTVMGLAAAATVATAVLIAITLLPALLSFAGTRVLRRRQRGAAAAPGAHARRRDSRWLRSIRRRPVVTLVAGVVGLGALALPVTGLELGLPDDSTAPPASTNRAAYDLLARGFGPGFNGPLLVTVAPPAGSTAAEAKAAAGAVAAAISDVPDVMAAVPIAVSPASVGDPLALIQVVPRSGPSTDATETLVHALRDRADELAGATGAELAVTGQTAMAIDIVDKLAAALPVYLAVVVGLALVLLLLVFSSIVVPVKAALGFLLSFGAALGAVVAVFQWGWLGALFGVETPGPIIAFLPILLVGVLFGLAMDYEVFMVSGMREAYVHGGDAARAVPAGFAAASTVVTAAAIIMASVFAGFVLTPDATIAAIGFALAFGVLVDAFVVRMVLVPAAMTLLGRAAWYLPRWLRSVLPDVDIGGARLGPAPGQHAGSPGRDGRRGGALPVGHRASASISG